MKDRDKQALDLVLEDYEDDLLIVIQSAVDGQTDRRQLAAWLFYLSMLYIGISYRMGGDDPTSKAGKRFIAEQERIHRRSATALAGDVFAGRYLVDASKAAAAAGAAAQKAVNVVTIGGKRILDKLPKLDLEKLKNRLRLWVNTLIRANTQAKLNAPIPPGQPEPRFVWVLGATEKHCSDCAAFAGKVLLQSEWARLPSPQSPDLECGGWNCDCSLVATDEPRTGLSGIID